MLARSTSKSARTSDHLIKNSLAGATRLASSNSSTNPEMKSTVAYSSARNGLVGARPALRTRLLNPALGRISPPSSRRGLQSTIVAFKEDSKRTFPQCTHFPLEN